MRKWKAFYDIWGHEQSMFIIDEFELPNELYEELNNAVISNTPIKKIACYDKILNIASNSLDIEKYDKYMFSEPDRDDFDSEEEYQEELEQYKEEKQEYYDDWGWETYIEDPGAEKRFKEKFEGRSIPGYEDETGSIDLRWDYECDGTDLDISLVVEYENGVLMDIHSIREQGLEWADIRSSSWGDRFPSYGIIAKLLEKELFAEEE